MSLFLTFVLLCLAFASLLAWHEARIVARLVTIAARLDTTAEELGVDDGVEQDSD